MQANEASAACSGALGQAREPVRVGNRLLQRLHRDYAGLLAELRMADDEPASGLLPESGWTLRDHVAHLAVWEALELARVEGRSGVPEHLEILREALFRRHRGGSLSAALEGFAAVHRRLVAALTDVPDATLRRLWHAAFPDSLAANVARNTYVHYAEHLPAIRRLAQERRRQMPGGRATLSI
jgi:Protein of unknown function (DUF1706)